MHVRGQQSTSISPLPPPLSPPPLAILKVGRVAVHGVLSPVPAAVGVATIHVAVGGAPDAVAALLHVVRLLEPRPRVPRVYSGKQVDDKGQDIKGKDEGDDPFENGRDVAMMGKGRGGKDNGQDELDEDEGELDPKGRAQDAKVAVF